MQRAHTDVQVPSSGEMKDIYTHISDLAAQIKREKYIEQLEAIESSTRNPQKVAQVMSLPLGSSSAASHPTQTYAARTLASPHFHSQNSLIHDSYNPVRTLALFYSHKPHRQTVKFTYTLTSASAFTLKAFYTGRSFEPSCRHCCRGPRSPCAVVGTASSVSRDVSLLLFQRRQANCCRLEALSCGVSVRE
jgi:hypothetical protein